MSTVTYDATSQNYDYFGYSTHSRAIVYADTKSSSLFNLNISAALSGKAGRLFHRGRSKADPSYR